MLTYTVGCIAQLMSKCMFLYSIHVVINIKQVDSIQDKFVCYEFCCIFVIKITNMISKSCKYAIRAAIYLASKTDEDIKLSAKEVANDIEAPEAFIGKILQLLRKHRIISSLKGPYGGFFCEEHQLSIPIINVVNAIDGLAVFNECVLGLNECSAEHPCPMHHQYIDSRDKMLKSFEETTIGDLATNLKLGSVFITNI